MKDLRVARGKVVGNTIVLEDEGVLPQGAQVEVFLTEDAEGWDVDEATWRRIDEARAAIRRGEFLTDAQLDTQLDALV